MKVGIYASFSGKVSSCQPERHAELDAPLWSVTLSGFRGLVLWWWRTV